MPAISALMPVYNSRRFVGEAVRSVLAQSFADFELVIVDDGSSDGSADAIAALAQADARIRLIRRENRGLIATRSELLAAAGAELVAWCDSDDRYDPQRFARQFEAFETRPELVALGSSWQMIDPAGLPIHTFSFPEDHEGICRIMDTQGNGMWFPTVMMRRDVARRVGGFREPFVIGEDYDLHLRMAEVGRVANLTEVLCFYRQHVSSTVATRLWQVAELTRLAQELAQERRTTGSDRLQRGEPVSVNFGCPPPHRVNRARLHTKWAWWALLEGHVRTARKHALLTARYAPASPETWRLLFCAMRGR